MANSRLYYTILSSQMAYSEQPTNALDISRLLQNRPAWRKPLGGTQRVKKNHYLGSLSVKEQIQPTGFFYALL